MIPMVFDDFLPAPGAVRAHALASEFVDHEAHDGETYQRVALTDVPGLHAAIEEQVGPIDLLGMGYRLNFAGELPNHAIHCDLGWGTHALVLYLCDGEGGTAFWRHKATGAERLDMGDVDTYEQVKGDWDNAEAWDRWGEVPLKFNRATIYESALFHSRFPFAAFGTGPDDGRLIAVAFFNVKPRQ